MDDGTGTDLDGVMGTFDAVGAGVAVTVTLTNQNGAAANPPGPFNGVTNANGQFDVTFTSATPGEVIGNATTTLVVGGVSLTRMTDGSAVGGGQSNSDPATKTFLGEPEIELEKFTRVDVNPIDIEKLVRVEGPPIAGDVCDVLGNPVALTFQYVPGSTSITDQDPGKADILFDSGMVDADGVSFVVVTIDRMRPTHWLAVESSSSAAMCRLTSRSRQTRTPTPFGSATFIYFFDNQSGGLLQSLDLSHFLLATDPTE